MKSALCFAYSLMDFDKDSFVDVNDLEILVNQWLDEPNSTYNADFDSSGRVDFRDFARFAKYWNPSPKFVISGKTETGYVTMIGLPGSPVSDRNGNYTVVVSYGWSGTVVPTKTGYNFSPSSIAYTSVTSNLTDRHYNSHRNYWCCYFRFGWCQRCYYEGITWQSYC